MKKKKISLEKKLSLNKLTVASLSKPQQHALAGGINTDYCNTYDPQVTCESHPRPGYVCY
ncbi:MAG: class I lanthipeptide [Chitinophaga sp.]|uniref:class I lanthipeptide n=1 Tax=Chitinophaga sp. TaxID=1869181 RepID=UPI0025BF3B59|nr:class I lanthipeptide [Chitinophaga sp.]MBV8252999.1 class I lanthipeptide [Chitinophaga sp.]